MGIFVENKLVQSYNDVDYPKAWDFARNIKFSSFRTQTKLKCTGD